MNTQQELMEVDTRSNKHETKNKELLKYLFPELIILKLLGNRLSGKLKPKDPNHVTSNEDYDIDVSVLPSYSEDISSQPSTLSTNSSMVNYSEPKQQLIDEKLLTDALERLENIVGLKEVKEFIYDLKDECYLNIQRVLTGQKVSRPTLHMIFTGNPGTGKTTIARIVADIFRALGMVYKNEIKEVTREDLVGQYQGHTAIKTREVIEESKGGVLFIDEAYSLKQDAQDSFGQEAIDALVKGMEENRENMIVILAGYSKEMYEFMKSNSGLKSRFPNQIEFKDYTADELLEIAKIEISKNDFIVEIDTLKVIHDILEQKQIPGRNDSGNGRLVRNVVEEARRKQSRRLMNDGGMDTLTSEELRLLIPKDFGYTEQEQFDLEKELSKIVGNEKVKDFIRQLAAQIKVQKLRKQQGIKSPSGQTLHIIFSGDPGTGKTTIARILGHMLKDLGVLKSGHLIETDRSGLVAGYTGQTAEKTNDIISQALGGILFIDEAYALASGGPGDFGKEAIDTLVKGMEDHRDNLLVILAGYEKDMEQFLQTNAGLRSRFPNKFNFENYSLVEMLKIAQIIIKSKGLKVSKGGFQTLKNELLPAVGNREAGNGRFVRNLIEKADRNQNLRISKMENPSKEELITLISDDFKGGV